MLKFERRQLTGWPGPVHFRCQLSQGFQLVMVMDSTRHHQQPTTDFVQGMLKLVAVAGRVDVDQYRANTCCGKQGQQPLEAVGCPDAHAVATADTHGQQGGGQVVGLLLQVVPTQALLLRHKHGCIPRTMAHHRAV